MHALMIKTGRRYRKATNEEVQSAAMHVNGERLLGVNALTNPRATREYLKGALGHMEHEMFCVLYLDNRNRVLKFNPMFRGTIDGASVHTREVIREALDIGAASVILAHNHPSGVSEPSAADELITRRLKQALSLVDIRLLDHLIVGNDVSSFAERGLL